MLARSHQIASFEHHIPFRGSGLAGDHIQERGLAGTIRADHGAQLPRLKAEVEIAQRQKAIKTDGDLAQLQ